MNAAMITVLVNVAGGRAQHRDAIAELQALLAARLPAAAVELIEHGDQLTARARTACAAGATVVAAAGGDGTLNAVAQALVKSEVRLGVLPFGTLNHFARDLHIPLDLAAAVDLLTTDQVRRIDVGAVNDHYFLNNASLGLYPQLVELRQHQTRARAKPLRWVSALWKLARTARPLTVALDTATTHTHRPTWLVFIGNNSYGLNIVHHGDRQRLDAGRLDVWVVRATQRRELARLVLQSMRSRVPARYLSRFAVDHLTIRPVAMATCDVAFDGEAGLMTGPFVFRSVPQALSVVAPPPA